MSLHLLKCLAVSQKLLDTRDAMHQVYGDRWPDKKSEVMPLLTALMAREHCEILVAAQKLARWAMDDGNAMMAAIILGTAVDVIEEHGEAVAA